MDLDDQVMLTVDFAAIPAADRAFEIGRLCDAMEAAAAAGRYPLLAVERPWSVHNPRLEGEFASPAAIRWYLERELGRLAADGARISVGGGRDALDLRDPRLGPAVDETRWDLRRKKLFLFTPERFVEPAGRIVYIGLSRQPSLVDSRDVALNDITAIGVLGASAGLASAIGHYADGRVDPGPLAQVVVGLDRAAEALAGRVDPGGGTKIHIDPRL